MLNTQADKKKTHLDASASCELGDEYLPHSKAAHIRGVSTRTLDRWVAAGLLPRPEIINKRKYHKRRDIDTLSNKESV